MTTATNQTTTVSSEVKQHIDSVANEAVTAQLERMVAQTTAQTTDLLLFDTDKPADPETHLPPLKAVMRQQATTDTKQQEHATTHTEAQQSKQTVTDVQMQGKGHWEQEAATVEATSVSKWTDGLMGTLGAVTGLVLTLIAIYVILKLKRKANE
jgi:hypothetical protein